MDAPNLTALEAMLGPHLTADQAAFVFKQGQEAVVFALLALAKQVAEKTACPDGSLKTTDALLTVKFSLPVGGRPGAPGGHILAIAGHRPCGSNVARTTESALFAGKIAHSELRILCFLSCLLFQDETNTMHALFAKLTDCPVRSLAPPP